MGERRAPMQAESLIYISPGGDPPPALAGGPFPQGAASDTESRTLPRSARLSSVRAGLQGVYKYLVLLVPSEAAQVERTHPITRAVMRRASTCTTGARAAHGGRTDGRMDSRTDM
jgi:hypothetical protein